MVLTRFKRSGSAEGHGFFGGIKTLRRRCKAGEVLYKSVRAEGGPEMVHRPLRRRKALEGEAQERRELKEASKGRRT